MKSREEFYLIEVGASSASCIVVRLALIIFEGLANNDVKRLNEVRSMKRKTEWNYILLTTKANKVTAIVRSVSIQQ